jgi:tryptophan-rich sensory protein
VIEAGVKALAGWLAASFVAAALGAVATRQAPEFYAQLVRPDWAPPGWLFGPVWTVLYALMGIAAWRVWRKAGFGSALYLFLAQLALNALWSWLFFAWRLGAAAFAEVVVLWALIAATLAAFLRIDRCPTSCG